MNTTVVRSFERLAGINLRGSDRLVVIGDVDRAAARALPNVREALARGLELVFRSDEEQEREEAAVERQRHLRDEPAEAAWKQAHARGPLSLPPSPAAARLSAPPLDANELADRAPPRAATGAMAGYTGTACNPRDLSWGDDTLPAHLARRVCAWPVPRLIGQGFAAASELELPAALRALLHMQLGPLPFHIDERGGFGGPWKYFHVHASIIAPPVGDVPMAIELYARVLGVATHDFATEEGARFVVRRDRTEPNPLPGPLWMHVEQATYSNVAYPGVNVPFYF